MMKKIYAFILACTVVIQLSGQEPMNLQKENIAINLTNSGIEYIKQKNSEEALKSLFTALTVNPKYREAYLQLFQAWSIKKEQSNEVLATMISGYGIFEEDDEFHFYCGEILRSQMELEKAIKEYTSAITYGKKNGDEFYLVPFYYLNRGNSYLKIEKYQLALADYNALLVLNSESLSGRTNRGIVYYQLKNKDKACADWKYAIRSDFQPARIYYQKFCQ